jgi:aldose 1-epimerase
MRPILAFSVLAVVATALPVSARQYSARQEGDVVRLEDSKNQMIVSIIPSAGDIAFEFSVKGQNVIRWPYASLADFKASTNGEDGIPFFGPWIQRLDQQAFYANGKKYNFDMELGNVRGTYPIHGFLAKTDQWRVLEVKSDADGAWVTSKLEVWKRPMWMKQWPFAHTVEITYRLRNGMLQVQTKITNLSAEPMPVMVGYHPFFQLTDSPREDWTITVGAKTHNLYSNAKIPTGVTEPTEKLFPDRQGSLKDYNLDDIFSDLERDPEGLAHFVVKGKQQSVDVMIGQNFEAMVIFSPSPNGQGLGSNALRDPNAPQARRRGRLVNPFATPNYFCIEPMATIVDASNLVQKGIIKNMPSVAPNQTWEASFWVKPSGF